MWRWWLDSTGCRIGTSICIICIIWPHYHNTIAGHLPIISQYWINYEAHTLPTADKLIWPIAEHCWAQHPWGRPLWSLCPCWDHARVETSPSRTVYNVYISFVLNGRVLNYYEREEIAKEAKKPRDTAPSHHTQNMGINCMAGMSRVNGVAEQTNLPCWRECVGTRVMKRRGTS